MKIHIFKSGWVSFANADYQLNMTENNIYLSYDNEKTIKCRNWIYGRSNKNIIEMPYLTADTLYKKYIK